jgi:hypothetical protein
MGSDAAKGAGIKMTPSLAELLRQVRDLPQRSRISRGSAPSGRARLEAAGYVRIVPINLSDLVTEIATKGQKALAGWEEDR